MQLTHLGHSCLLVDVAGARLLVDPGVFSRGWEELAGLDAVLVTHAHPDHVDEEKLPQLLAANPGAHLLTEPGLAEEMRRVGIEAQPLHPGESVEVGEGGATVRAEGGRHAVIHADIPRIGNVGYLVTGPDEPTLFHPGDAYEYTPPGVDVLAVPLNAPWAAFKEAVEFARAVSPDLAVPVHDGLLAPNGREIYLRQLTSLAGCEVRDLAGAGPVEV